MRITFENNQNPNLDKINTTERVATKSNNKNTAESILDISGMVMDNAYGVQGRTAKDVMQEASNIDVTNQKNYATVMSNSMSAKDFAKMQEEGLNPNDMEIEEVVTIVDRIKAELAKSGVNVVGYTDDIDAATLTEITGSEVMANAIMDEFGAKDLPVTEENAKDTAVAYQKAMELTALTEGELKYLVLNQLQPTIDQLYLAKFSGSMNADKQGKGYFTDTAGYFSKKPENIDWNQLQPQMEKVIAESGLPLEEATMENAKWLVEKGVPLTSENLVALEEMKQVSLPAEKEEVISAIAVAISEGKKAGEANLAYAKGVAYNRTDYVAITETRVMEETRLKMTIEANWKLMESGFSIDTSELEQLVDALKSLEEEYAGKLTGFENPSKDLDLFKETIQKTAEIRSIPAAVVGKFIYHETTWSLDTFYTEGKQLQKSFEDATKDYETLMTAPRRDMGDSIKKAFRNVDAILDDMELERSEINQRAVRILGYNSMEITKESVATVAEADLSVRRIVEKMTPSKVLSMIREGVNPLETSMEDLSNFLDSKEDPQEKMEKYSKFLQRLEASGEVSAEEKESYIGIYRLLRQIEKSDGSVIGSLVQTGAEMNFKNLLSAVRTEKKGSMNITVDDGFGGLTDVKSRGEAIDVQINAAYLAKLSEKLADRMAELEAQMNDNAQNEYKMDEYDKQQLKDFREACHTEEEVFKFLTDLKMPVTPNYILAAKEMLQKRGSQYDIKDDVMEEEELLNLSDEFVENFDGKEKAVKNFRKFTDTIKERINSQYLNSDNSIDVKGLQMTYKQLSIATKMSAEENYEIPVNIKGEITSIRVKILHQTELKGTVTVTTQMEQYGKLSAKIAINDRSVSGYAIATHKEGKEFLEEIREDFEARLNQQDYTLDNYSVAESETLNFTAVEDGSSEGDAQTKELYQVAKMLIMTLKS